MAATNINIRTDSEIKAKAQSVLSDLGLDMSTAINLYLNQIIYKQAIPFEISKLTAGKPKPAGSPGAAAAVDGFFSPNMRVAETARKYERLEHYTYADYAGWDDGNRYELIDGEAYMMSAPSVVHQRVLRELLMQIAAFLNGKACEVFAAPFDVCLFGLGDNDDTVVQPDILVICDKSKLNDGKRCNGAPDLTIEIVSPSTSKLDRLKKHNKYLQAGVREYWIVDPDDKSVLVHILKNGGYAISAHDDTETIAVGVLEGCNIDLSGIFVE